ncbi:hypothetical protein EDB19DRAFT_1175719 [Suillus lakei]|nr:hypothetical protein EDB19DRAFT_1175719 [Suillus lakei]
MTLLLCALLLCVPFVGASLPSLNDTNTRTLDASECPSCNTRTLWDILLSCGLTIFACTWSAVHTNIPGRDEGRATITSRRLFIMIMALIAPELMITWATRQFFSARATAKEFNDEFAVRLGQFRDRQAIWESKLAAALLGDIPNSSGNSGWTVTHGFFAWMGGFMLYVDGEPRGTLDPDELLVFVRSGSVDMPVISQVEIEDRGKGDGLSKGIALLQLAWFFVQLVARYAQNLPITLLEIDTLAAAALTCVAYSLWWKKPKDVRCPYIVYWKAENQPCLLTYEDADLYRVGLGRVNSFIYPFISLTGIRVFISPRAARFRRVPSLGGYGEHHDKIVLLVGCFSGMVFGAIHCLGWNYLFQIHTEHMLWRAASLGIACAPVLLFLDVGLILWVGYGNMSDLHNIIALFSAIIIAFIYFVARVTLIVLMILSLRSLPLGVYDTVAWTTFIPHL